MASAGQSGSSQWAGGAGQAASGATRLEARAVVRDDAVQLLDTACWRMGPARSYKHLGIFLVFILHMYDRELVFPKTQKILKNEKCYVYNK